MIKPFLLNCRRAGTLGLLLMLALLASRIATLPDAQATVTPVHSSALARSTDTSFTMGGIYYLRCLRIDLSGSFSADGSSLSGTLRSTGCNDSVTGWAFTASDCPVTLRSTGSVAATSMTGSLTLDNVCSFSFANGCTLNLQPQTAPNAWTYYQATRTLSEAVTLTMTSGSGGLPCGYSAIRITGRYLFSQPRAITIS